MLLLPRLCSFCQGSLLRCQLPCPLLRRVTPPGRLWTCAGVCSNPSPYVLAAPCVTPSQGQGLLPRAWSWVGQGSDGHPPSPYTAFGDCGAQAGGAHGGSSETIPFFFLFLPAGRTLEPPAPTPKTLARGGGGSVLRLCAQGRARRARQGGFAGKHDGSGMASAVHAADVGQQLQLMMMCEFVSVCGLRIV